VLLANANGTFQSAVSYPGGVGPTYPGERGSKPRRQAGFSDGEHRKYSFSVLFGNGNGTFQAPVHYSVAGQPTAIIAADFNRDGDPDVAVTANSAANVFLADGNGGFKAAAGYPMANAAQYLTAGDFNHDGKLDMVSSSVQLQVVSVLLGNGDGTFQALINSATGGNTQPAALAVGDFIVTAKRISPWPTLRPLRSTSCWAMVMAVLDAELHFRHSQPPWT